MLDFNPAELLVVAVVALVVIGPKDLPKAMRLAGKWVGRARGVARQFRSGFDAMVREAELAEMEKQWKAENERIMREFPQPSLNAPHALIGHSDTGPEAADPEPVMVEQPLIHIPPEPVAPAESEVVAPAPRRRAAKPKAAVQDMSASPAPKPRKPRAKAQP
ncbi:Sec-independent protein translocase protein TatB [Sphingomonas sp.]|uniref:Sec-independent protein translocase protein TatB n=1 Tax=Sphingomonas sp. TaxID=28214 RepID=UPI001B1FFC66|nr:Sec-independent protein translocase protein TatB [Sphingomonas sp.]MBO9714316.1 twin-arginine translocase subunit TatB [Sphingomonas sp.]